MIGLLMTIHVLLAVLLIIVVLMQQARGGGLGGVFGGAQTIFGGKGAQPFFLKATSILGGLFMLSSISIAYAVSHRGEAPVPVPPPVQQEQTVPSVPETPSGMQEENKTPVPAQNVEIPQIPQTPEGGK